MSKLKIKNFIILWLPVLFWCAVIYYLSSISNLKSDLPNQWDFVFRKIAHITEYAVLTFLFFRASSKNLNFRRAVSYSALFSITYALTDEYHQLFVFGRGGNLGDVLIDSFGVFLAIVLIYKKKLSC
ncbi:MAG: VanZ family protein [Patescibacteria group bacterium]|nr:VanZ family protein [Patescibacteria group bacterium]